NGHRQELIGLVHHRPAVARGARPDLEVGRRHAEVGRQILEEDPSALFRRGAAARQPGRMLAGEGEQRNLERAEELRTSPLELRDEIELTLRYNANALSVIPDRAERLRLQRRLTAVE